MFNPIGWINPGIAQAHCDIPCGIYDSVSAKMAAQTVQKMVLRMQALERPDGSDTAAFVDCGNKPTRYVTVKEEHAEIARRNSASSGPIADCRTPRRDSICIGLSSLR